MLSGISSGMPSMAQMSQMQAKMFSKADADGSGGLDAKEFSSMLDSSPMSSMSASDRSQLFSKLDTDGNGSVSQAELQKGAQSAMESFRSTLGSFGGQASTSAGGASSTSSDPLQTFIDSLSSTSGSSSKKSDADKATGTTDSSRILEQLKTYLTNALSQGANGLQLATQA